MGPMTETLTKKINELNLNDKIIYHGPMPASKAAPYFKAADALYISLKDEGHVGRTIPNKLVMSMAFNKPILAMLGGDGKEILKQSGGAIFAEQNPQSLADAIVSLSSIPEETLKKLGKMNLDYYKTHFSLVNVSREIEKYLL